MAVLIFSHSYTQHAIDIFIEYLLHSRCGAGFWGYISEQDSCSPAFFFSNLLVTDYIIEYMLQVKEQDFKIG